LRKKGDDEKVKGETRTGIRKGAVERDDEDDSDWD
jgi:hypothetical protein